MTDSLPAHLAARFRDDAQALRARATVLDAQGGRGAGPDAAACRAMADACDRVSGLFASAADELGLTDVGRQLDRLLDGEPHPDVKHVYSGALTRLRQALDAESGDVGADDEDDEE
jgi:hypothetical protein